MTDELLKHFWKAADDFCEAAACGIPDDLLEDFQWQIRDPLNKFMERIAPRVGEEWPIPE